MRGNDLARVALDLRPGLKVVFASGYGDDAPIIDGASRLGKPYEQAELAKVLGAAAE
jgi:hypothetical protein